MPMLMVTGCFRFSMLATPARSRSAAIRLSGSVRPYAVTFGMPEAVVDLLEVVKIEDQYRRALPAAVGGREELPGVLVKRAPVVQAGQPVMVGEEFEFGVQPQQFAGLALERVLRRLALGNVAHHTKRQVFAAQDHRAQHDLDGEFAAVLA